MNGKGAGQGQRQIHEKDRDPDLHGQKGPGHQFIGPEGELGDGDDRNNGGVFDQGYELAGQGRQNALKGLGQDDVPHLLVFGHAQRVGCFPLAPVDGLDSGSDDFSNVRTQSFGPSQFIISFKISSFAPIKI